MAPILGIWASSLRAFTIEGSMEPIAVAVAPSGGLSTVTFGSIPQTYTHLQIRGIVQDVRGSTGTDILYYRFNSDSGNNYSWHSMWGNGSSVVANFNGASSNIGLLCRNSVARDGNLANCFSAFVTDILDYTNTNKNKTVRTLIGTNNNSTIDSVEICSSAWYNTGAVTAITLQPEAGVFAQFSSFALYGIKGA